MYLNFLKASLGFPSIQPQPVWAYIIHIPLSPPQTYTDSTKFQSQIAQMQSHKENRNTNIFNWWGDKRKVNNELWLHQTFTEQYKAEQNK